jgi:hypothetical protein
VENLMPRITFWQLFKQNDDNTLEVLRKVRIGSVELDEGSTITRGTLIGGLDFFNYIHLSADAEGDQVGDTWVLKKVIYKENEQ